MLYRRLGVLAVLAIALAIAVPVSAESEPVCEVGVYPPIGVTGIISGEAGAKVGWYITNHTGMDFWRAGEPIENETWVNATEGTVYLWTVSNLTSVTLKLNTTKGRELWIRLEVGDWEYSSGVFSTTFKANWTIHPETPDNYTLIFNQDYNIPQDEENINYTAEVQVRSGWVYLRLWGDRYTSGTQDDYMLVHELLINMSSDERVDKITLSTKRLFYPYPWERIIAFYGWSPNPPTCDTMLSQAVAQGQIPIHEWVWSMRYGGKPAFLYETRLPEEEGTYYFIWGVKAVNTQGQEYYLIWYVSNVTITGASSPGNPIVGAIWGFLSWLGGVISSGLKSAFMGLWSLLPPEVRDFFGTLYNIASGLASLVYALGVWFSEYFTPFLQLLVYIAPVLIVLLAIENPLAPVDFFKWLIGLIQKVLSAIRAVLPI